MKKTTVLIIGTVWVEPNSSAAGSRMLQLIEEFLKENWQITFACAVPRSEKAFDLTSLGINTVSIELNNCSFDFFVKELNPDIVLFDRFLTEEQFGWRVAENCPNSLRILDTEDLHCLRKGREIAVKNNQDFRIEDLLKLDITKREIASILRCDLSLIISSFEMNLLKSTFNIDEQILYYLPFLFDEIEENHTKQWKLFEERKDFIFIGNFYHKPNIDAVIQLKKHIWKTIRKELPNVEIHIYGAYINQQIQQLHNKKEGFLIKGFVEDSNFIVSQAKVVLAPLRFGAGIKGKLTQAMRCGTPSITSKIGAEAMQGNISWNGFIADNHEDFAQKAIKLYQQKEVWQNAQQNGIEIINTIYNKEKLGKPFITKIKNIQNDLQNHRDQNFLGSLLQHQTLQATKFMSKWIEAKNKF